MSVKLNREEGYLDSYRIAPVTAKALASVRKTARGDIRIADPEEHVLIDAFTTGPGVDPLSAASARGYKRVSSAQVTPGGWGTSGKLLDDYIMLYVPGCAAARTRQIKRHRYTR